MSFCQKHENHHCVHTHHCTNFQHKKLMNKSTKSLKNDPSSGTLRQSSKNLKKIMQENQQQQCHFKSQSMNKLRCETCKRLAKQLEDQNKELTQCKKQQMETQKKSAKLYEENRKFQGVIEYYREEMDRIIKCTEEDVRNEIKRHFKQNTELVGKNKSLLNKLSEVQVQVDKLREENQKLSRKVQSISKQKNELEINYDILLQKFRKIHNDDKNKINDLSNVRNKTIQLETRYQIIIEQLRKNAQEKSRQNKKLQNQNKDLIHQLEVIKSKLTSQEKISKMEQQATQQREIIFKKKLQNNQKQINAFKESISKLELALKLKEEQLVFSKQVIQKQLKLIKENKELFEEVQKNFDAEKENQQHQSSPDATAKNFGQRFGYDIKNEETYIKDLKSEIKSLKQKITFLESQPKNIHNTQTIEEYILTIGASQAFKKIIEQKNAHIKKLIREKGALLQQI